MNNPIFRKMMLALLLLAVHKVYAQYPNACGSVNSRANSNGQPSNCAGVSTTPIASNFTGTSYASVPATAKTADITLKYTNISAATLKPYAITGISGYVNGVYTVFTSVAGPAGVPSVTGSNDALVKYCIYTTNLPTAGQLTFQLTNPETGIVAGSCTYDASCLSNCVPANIVLPLSLVDFRVSKTASGIQLEWITEEEFGMNRFEIERSINGYDFSVIGLAAATNTGARKTYIFSDNQASKGVLYYYRLKMLNSDGSFIYSQIKTSRLDGFGFSVKNGGANPFVNRVNLIIESPVKAEAVLKLIDAKGGILRSRKLILPEGISNTQLADLDDLPAGTYIVKITCGGLSQKLTLIK